MESDTLILLVSITAALIASFLVSFKPPACNLLGCRERVGTGFCKWCMQPMGDVERFETHREKFEKRRGNR